MNCPRAAAKAAAVTWGSGGEEVMMPASMELRAAGAAGGVNASRAWPLWRLPRPEPLRAKCPSESDVLSRAVCPPAAGSPAGEVAAAGSAPRRERAPAHPPVHPLGDPASSPRPLEVCKLSPRVRPHRWEVGTRGKVPGSPSPLPPPLPPLDRTSGGFRTLPGLWRQTHTPDS